MHEPSAKLTICRHAVGTGSVTNVNGYTFGCGTIYAPPISGSLSLPGPAIRGEDDMNTGSASRLAVLVMTLISTLLLAQGVAMAGVPGGSVTFLDLADTITVSDTTGRASVGFCTGESCGVNLAGPAGATSLTPDLVEFFTEPGT